MALSLVFHNSKTDACDPANLSNRAPLSFQLRKSFISLISVHIANPRQQVRVIFNRLTLKPVPKQMPCSLILRVISIQGACTDSPYDCIQRLFSFMQYPMNMIRHQAITIQPIAIFIPIFFQCLQKPSIILIIFEYLLPVDPPQHDMMDAAVASFSAPSRHIILPLSIFK